jgi:hypothetical protein
MILTLPCDAQQPQSYSDVDFGGDVITYRSGGQTHRLRTMSGPFSSSGRPSAEKYLNAVSFNERGWMIRLERRLIDGLDVKGTSRDGTYWRWVGPILGEFAEYSAADRAAAKYFDSILDGMCYQPKF